MRKLCVCRSSCECFDDMNNGFVQCSRLDDEPLLLEEFAKAELTKPSLKCLFMFDQSSPTLRKMKVCRKCPKFAVGIRMRGSRSPKSYLCVLTCEKQQTALEYRKGSVPTDCEYKLEQIVL